MDSDLDALGDAIGHAVNNAITDAQRQFHVDSLAHRTHTVLVHADRRTDDDPTAVTDY